MRFRLGLVALLVLIQSAQAAETEPPNFTVRIVDLSSSPDNETRNAILIADRAFRAAGFRVRWLDCNPGAGCPHSASGTQHCYSRFASEYPGTVPTRSSAR